jgi:predicted transcriptional regulator
VSQRDAPLESRPRKLDDDRRARVFALAAQDRALREIAAEVGVSHETVRAVLTTASAVA